MKNLSTWKIVGSERGWNLWFFVTIRYLLNAKKYRVLMYAAFWSQIVKFLFDDLPKRSKIFDRRWDFKASSEDDKFLH